jgi:hypothetical protein
LMSGAKDRETGFGKHPCTKIREVEPAICRMPRYGI